MENRNFADKMKIRTKQFAISALKLCDELPYNQNSTRIIANQLGRSASSTGANYRSACVARSDKEFYSKLSICIEESDESNFWLEVLEEAGFYANKDRINSLKGECTEIVKILFSARNSLNNKQLKS